MPAKVVDASALACVLFEEPEGDTVETSLEGADLIAPSLLVFEVANVCINKIRRGTADRDTLIAAFSTMAELAISTVEVDPLAILDLAEQTGLTAYDASYLRLALDEKAELVTLDKRLATVARRLITR